MIKKKDFLKEYNIEKETLKKTGMKWEELNSIYDSYCRLEPQLKKIGKDFVNDYLYDIEKAGIHSYRYRTKKAGHLLEKIIRKKSEQPDQYKYINRKNYYKYMTDLIGIRVFFLYREDWIHFHNYITSVFENDPANYIEDRLLDFDDDPDHYYIAERPKVYRRLVIPAFTIRSSSTSSPTAFTVLCTTSSSIKATTWKSREEPCSRRAGARLTMISSIHITRMMRCFPISPRS